MTSSTASIRILALCGLALAAGLAYGQGTLADYERASGLREKFQNLAPGVPESASCIASTSRFWYRKTVPGGQFYYIRGLGLVRDTADIGNIILQEKNGIPVYVKDIAKVEIGHAPRLGQFGYMRQEEAVEGVILMRVGEQAQVILRRVEAMTKELNEHVLPPDVKVVP